jgi:hypothetical protein
MAKGSTKVQRIKLVDAVFSDPETKHGLAVFTPDQNGDLKIRRVDDQVKITCAVRNKEYVAKPEEIVRPREEAHRPSVGDEVSEALRDHRQAACGEVARASVEALRLGQDGNAERVEGIIRGRVRDPAPGCSFEDGRTLRWGQDGHREGGRHGRS